MKKLGVQQIKINKHRSCYFVIRPFGNYLIFSDHLELADESFFTSHGGIYKQFVQNPESVGQAQCTLFSRYGAMAVGLWNQLPYHANLAFERFNQEFMDPAITFTREKYGMTLSFEQPNHKVKIMGDGFYLTKKSRIQTYQDDVTDELQESFAQDKVDHVFFSHYEKSGHLEIKKKGALSCFGKFFPSALCFFAFNSFAIDQYYMKKRIILVANNSTLIKKQREVLAKHRPGLIERKLLIIPAQASEQKLFRDGNKALLIGLDGGVKARSNSVFKHDFLFKLIDQMPMRKREIKP